MTKYIFMFLVVAGSSIFIPKNTEAQKGNCTNTTEIHIVEIHSNLPVPFAVVHLDESNASYTTDESGHVMIPDLCQGTYTVHVISSGNEPLLQSLDIPAKGVVYFKVHHFETSLSNVTVTAEREKFVMQSKQKMNNDDLAKHSGENLANLLSSMNGVNVLNNGATIAKPIIHGLHSNRIVMMNNGIRQEDQQWGQEHAPDIDPFLMDNITVVKGAAGVRYGADAIAGVVLMNPPPLPAPSNWKGRVNLAAFSNNRMGVGALMLEKGFKKIPGLGLRLQGSMKRGGNFKTPTHWVSNSGVKEMNYSAAIGYNKVHFGTEINYSHFSTTMGIYPGSHVGNQLDLEAAIESDTPLVFSKFSYDIQQPKQKVAHDQLKWKTYLDNRLGRWTLTGGFQHNFRQEYDLMRVPTDRAQLNLTLNTYSVNLNLDHQPIKKLEGEIGVDAAYQQNFSADGDRIFLPNYNATSWAIYNVENWHNHKWKIEAGWRYDFKNYTAYNPEGSNQTVKKYEWLYQNLSATLGAKYDHSAGVQSQLTAAYAWRAPQPNELLSNGLHLESARMVLGNVALKPERAAGLNYDFNLEIHSRFLLELGLYHQYIKDFIYLKPGEDVLTIRGYYKRFDYQQTDASLTGADVQFKYLWNSKFDSKLKGSYLYARDLRKRDFLILMPANRVELDNTFRSALGATTHILTATLNGQYVFQQKHIPEDFDAIDYPRPPAAFFLLQAGLGIDWKFEKTRWRTSLQIMNLTNTQYRNYLDGFRYFLDRPGTNFVFRTDFYF